MASDRSRARLFWAIVLAVVISDVVTKWIAVGALGPGHLPKRVLGDVVRLTLVYNTGAAFGISLGQHSREIFAGLSVAALFILGRLYMQTALDQRPRLIALALVTAGAVGNLVDRVRSGRGVVDFIDVGIGTMRWPTFNVADSAISCGAVLLALVLWREDATKAATVRAADTPVHG